MRRIIIDTDPGIDDALALMLAFSSPELEVEAVTTVVGNVSQDKAHTNTLKMLEFLGVDDVPVARGAVRPMLRDPRHAEEYHGRTGLGDAVLPDPAPRPDPRSAVSLILEKSNELGKGLTIVAVGPLTNIASAILVDPGLVGEVAGIVVMGGAFGVTPYGHGNATAVAEFNVWHDPEAARIVFGLGVPVTAVGLDVTKHPGNRLTPERFGEIERLETRRARLVADLTRSHVRRFGGFSLHDPLTVAAVVDPSLVKTQRFSVDVETVGELTRGQTVADRRPPHHIRGGIEPNVDVCVSFDGERFWNMFMERVVHGRVSP